MILDFDRPDFADCELLILEDIVENQYHDFDKFLSDVDFIVVMVSHDEIKQNMEQRHHL